MIVRPHHAVPGAIHRLRRALSLLSDMEWFRLAFNRKWRPQPLGPWDVLVSTERPDETAIVRETHPQDRTESRATRERPPPKTDGAASPTPCPGDDANEAADWLGIGA